MINQSKGFLRAMDPLLGQRLDRLVAVDRFRAGAFIIAPGKGRLQIGRIKRGERIERLAGAVLEGLLDSQNVVFAAAQAEGFLALDDQGQRLGGLRLLVRRQLDELDRALGSRLQRKQFSQVGKNGIIASRPMSLSRKTSIRPANRNCFCGDCDS